GDRIVAVGATATLAGRYPGATRHDFPGGTLLPGFVDSHVHSTFSAGPMPFEDIQSDSDVVIGVRGAINARDALQAGVTTMRDLGGRDRTTLQLRDAVHAGALPGPRMLVSGRPITTPNGHCHFLGGVAHG